MKGTEIKKLMWIYSDERMRRKQRYVKAGKQADDWNRKLYKPYRCEKVMKRLLRIDSDAFVKRLNRKEAFNAGS
ncbi:MarR family transcriptional regulator [Proteus mirabilis]|uniref:MarR family transcriptional regulator n=1 Tax=Proteus mirabilis TaxID=584 RepID=UPI0012EC25FD|nr:MarR family transcriptional regulator [Proteus mirabilis]MVD48985.1 MarR family transcriptional regulator [Proteus mirabilis]MVD71667.1 MarR family transcriptional regulator [Proteus mirabilis]MVF40131.1 MarR family transcriptional regulator [Proteus mirabilis]NHU35144.1 MarR family transcriptional regulator [Proteus mirabilis]QKQ96108.1 MarR family transcriptional regulator [Proteus mirabilis]